MNNWNKTTGKYTSVCHNCNSIFYGRKNQIYCNKFCKAKFNNDKNSSINLLVKNEIKDLRQKTYFLQNRFQNKIRITIKELKENNFNLPLKEVYSAKLNKNVHQIGNFILEPKGEACTIYILHKINNSEPSKIK